MNKVKIIQIENNTDKPIKTVILPDNSLVLGFHSGNTVYEIVNDKKVILPKIQFCGQLTQKKEYLREPDSKSTLVKIQPWEFNLVLNGLHELTDKNADCSDLVKNKEELFTRLENEIDVPTFLNKLFLQKNIDKSIFQALKIINETNGQIRIDDLANKVCSSKRNFERKFKTVTGLTPKEYIKNTRFTNSVKLLKADDNLTEITYDCGYYDQSHFIHDFKEVTGTTPENYTEVIQPIENWALAKKVYH